MQITKELHDKLLNLRRAIIQDGVELHNPTPVAIPAGHQAPESLEQRIQRVLRTELSRQAGDQGHETFDEANDFDVPEEDTDPISQYEVNEMVEEQPPSPPNDPSADPADTAPGPNEPSPETSPEDTGTETP